jgi:hypothetical protein
MSTFFDDHNMSGVCPSGVWFRTRDFLVAFLWRFMTAKHRVRNSHLSLQLSKSFDI